MELSITDLRRIIKRFESFHPSDCLTQEEVDSYFRNTDDGKSNSIVVDGFLLDHIRVSNVQTSYDTLEVYIKLLQELCKYRPLPF